MSVNVFYTSRDIRYGEVPVGLDNLRALPISGQLFKTEESVTSFYGNCDIIDAETGESKQDKCVIKSARGFGNSVVLAYDALKEWRELGFRGAPYSCASFTREMFMRHKRAGKIKSRCVASANNMLRPYFTGGWVESTARGYCFDPIYHYDINSAYMHAASLGLPARLYPYTGNPDSMGYVAVMEIEGKTDHLPNFLSKFDDDNGILVTSEDVKRYNLRGRILWGVEYFDLDVDVLPILEDLSHLPRSIFKRCTQSFWGMFASFSGVDIEDYETGEERKLWNRNQNIVWASLIVRRVAGIVYDAMVDFNGVSCYVDSVLTEKPLSGSMIGSEVGQWKLEGVYEKGILIDAAGVWHPLPFVSKAEITNKRRWKKHAGTYNG